MTDYDSNPTVLRSQIDADVEIINQQIEFLESFVPKMELIDTFVKSKTDPIVNSRNIKELYFNAITNSANKAAYEISEKGTQLFLG